MRKKDTIAFISKLESAGASSSSQSAGSGGVLASVQLGVLASSAVDIPSFSVCAGVSSFDVAVSRLKIQLSWTNQALKLSGHFLLFFFLLSLSFWLAKRRNSI